MWIDLRIVCMRRVSQWTALRTRLDLDGVTVARTCGMLGCIAFLVFAANSQENREKDK